jgi:hypothetical protein
VKNDCQKEDDSLVTPANNLTMLNDLSVHIPLSTSPSSPFIWNDYYHNLALSGLHDCWFTLKLKEVKVVVHIK